MEHKIIALSLDDAVIKCSCSWQQVRTGSITKTEARKEFERHLYNEFVHEWRKNHYISKAPSFTSWKTNYKK